jgi:hypothetical protein
MNDQTIAMSESAPEPEWTLTQWILFRFAFVYFVLYIFPFPIRAVPQGEIVGKPYEDCWNAVVPWVGKHVFQVEITVRPNGSGDTTYNYLQVFCFLVIAAVAAALWSLCDRERKSYTRLFEWLRVYVRFSLAATMIAYGAVKVIKSQFPAPGLDRLVQPFGDASPMGLLWTLMGASEGYNLFTGAGELAGGLLLTARHTTLLGALVSVGVLSHVLALNLSYDVPVKLFSGHLLAMAFFLMLPDLGRLTRLFVLNRGVERAEHRPLFGRVWLDRVGIMLRTLLVVLYLGMALMGASESRKTYGELAPKSPLYGIWNVDEFEVDGKARPPLVTDPQRWRRVIFDHPKGISIYLMSDSRVRYALNLDTSQQTLVLTKRDDPAWKTTISYQRPEPGLLTLEGTMDGKQIRAKLRLGEKADFRLLNRGFHWINEYPFNR